MLEKNQQRKSTMIMCRCVDGVMVVLDMLIWYQWKVLHLKLFKVKVISEYLVHRTNKGDLLS